MERNCWTKCNGKPGNGIVKNLRRQIDLLVTWHNKLLVTWSNIKCLHYYIHIYIDEMAQQVATCWRNMNLATLNEKIYCLDYG